MYYLCTTKKQNLLSSGVMVALRILVPPVRVRILPRQQNREYQALDFSFLMTYTTPLLSNFDTE